MPLSGSCLVVTGGAGQLGRVIVDALSNAAAKVVVIDRNDDACRQLAAERSDVVVYTADLAEDSDVTAAFENIERAHGPIRGLVHAAGRIHSAPLVNPVGDPARHSLTDWSDIIRDNLTTAFLCGACCADRMLESRTKGSLVFISSVAARGNPGQTAYAAAKGGIEAMVRTWGRELGPLGIRAVAVAPGFVDTASTHANLDDRTVTAKTRETPLRRLGRGDEIADAVLFALQNDFLTATTIAVDGGYPL